MKLLLDAGHPLLALLLSWVSQEGAKLDWGAGRVHAQFSPSVCTCAPQSLHPLWLWRPHILAAVLGATTQLQAGGHRAPAPG